MYIHQPSTAQAYPAIPPGLDTGAVAGFEAQLLYRALEAEAAVEPRADAVQLHPGEGAPRMERIARRPWTGEKHLDDFG